MEAVDRLHDRGLRPAGALRHRVERHPVEDPRRRVALEEEVRQRRQDHVERAGGARRAARRPRRSPPWSSRRSGSPRLLRRSPRRPFASADRPDTGRPRARRARGRASSPCPRATRASRQQVLGVEDLDAALAHHLDERRVLDLRLADPDHVVEEQLLGVGRRQPALLEARAGERSPCAACPPRIESTLNAIRTRLQLATTQPRSPNAADEHEGDADDQDDPEVGEHEAQVAVIADPRQRQAAHDHRRGRRDQIDQARGGLVRGHRERAGHVGEIGQRGEDRHHERRVTG